MDRKSETKSERRTATVIPFPGRGRPGIHGGHGVAEQTRAARPDLPAVEHGSGWYHDAAIRDATRER